MFYMDVRYAGPSAAGSMEADLQLTDDITLIWGRDCLEHGRRVLHGHAARAARLERPGSG